MTTKAELIEQLDAAYQDYLAAIDGLEERQFESKWLDGKWGVREISAHITGWHGTLAAALERMARGEKPVPEGEDWTAPDPYNETFAEHAKGKQRNQVLHELENSVRSFKTAAMKVPEERYGEGKTANRIFGGAGIEHFGEHAAVIRLWREREGV